MALWMSSEQGQSSAGGGISVTRPPLAILQGVRFEFAGEVLCTRCQCPLDCHQPDPERPEQLLGTCLDCGAWHLLDGEAHLMYALPDLQALRGG